MISIGKDKWIKWIEFDSQKSKILNIDELLEPTWDFWELLETECAAACCGINAFSFWIEDIQKTAILFDKSELLAKLVLLKEEIASQCKYNPRIILYSLKLNYLFDKSVFIQLIDHIINTIDKHIFKMNNQS